MLGVHFGEPFGERVHARSFKLCVRLILLHVHMFGERARSPNGSRTVRSAKKKCVFKLSPGCRTVADSVGRCRTVSDSVGQVSDCQTVGLSD